MKNGNEKWAYFPKSWRPASDDRCKSVTLMARFGASVEVRGERVGPWGCVWGTGEQAVGLSAACLLRLLA